MIDRVLSSINEWSSEWLGSGRNSRSCCSRSFPWRRSCCSSASFPLPHRCSSSRCITCYLPFLVATFEASLLVIARPILDPQLPQYVAQAALFLVASCVLDQLFQAFSSQIGRNLQGLQLVLRVTYFIALLPSKNSSVMINKIKLSSTISQSTTPPAYHQLLVSSIKRQHTEQVQTSLPEGNSHLLVFFTQVHQSESVVLPLHFLSDATGLGNRTRVKSNSGQNQPF